jgi:hypothetical protein
MSNPESASPGKADSPKKQISPTRNIIGIILLLAVVAYGLLEYSAKYSYNGVVKALDARAQNEEKELMTVQEAEAILGRSPDGPGTDVKEVSGEFTKKTYTWKGLLKSYTLAAYYTKGDKPLLHHFESQGAKYEPETASGVEPAKTITVPGRSKKGS